MDYEKAWKELKKQIEEAISLTPPGNSKVSYRAVKSHMEDVEGKADEDVFPKIPIQTSYSIPKGMVLMGYWQENNGKLEFKELGRIENVKA